MWSGNPYLSEHLGWGNGASNEKGIAGRNALAFTGQRALEWTKMVVRITTPLKLVDMVSWTAHRNHLHPAASNQT